jgi:putative ABC transport system permease protein
VLRAPLLLLRFPATLLAVLVASLLLALAGAASPLFVASAGNAALEREIASSGGSVPAFEVRRPSEVVPDILRYRDEVVRRHLDVPGLGEPVIGGIGSLADLRVAGPGMNRSVRMVTRAGAFDHVEVVAGERGEGVWVADRVADRLDIEPGDHVTVSRLGDPGFRVRVAAVYRDLALTARDPYWAPFSGIIYPADPDDAAPPSFLLADPVTFLSLQPRLSDRAEFVWSVSLEGEPTLEEARTLASRLQGIGGMLSDETTELGSALASASYQTPLPTWVGQADRTVGALLTPVETISMAGRGVALAVVIAAGVYVVRRRRVEFTVMHARGVAPARLGARVAVEALLPLAAGAAAGVAAAVALIGVLGPGRFTADAVREAAIGAGIGAAVGLVAIGVSAALAVRSLDEPSVGRFRGVVSRVPWEAIVLTLAAAALYEAVVRGGEPLIGDNGEVTIDRLLLLFPLLLLAGGAGVFVRLLRRVMPRLRGVSANGSPALYLSSRRLAGAPRTAGVLITASALGLGMLAYASLLSSSIRGSADVKAHVAVGSDVAAEVTGPADDLSIGLPSTPVTVLAEVEVSPAGGSADLVGIDPRTFEEGAFWDGSLGASLEDVLRALERETDALAVVVAGGGASGAIDSVSVEGVSIPVSVGERLEGFPGMPRSRPVVVADVARLTEALDDEGAVLSELGPRYELWARGDPEEVRRRIESAGRGVAVVRSVADVRDTPAFQSLAWTFGFLEALGVAAGLIALVGLVLYLQTRQRSREISYALARRMGLSPRAHRRSVAIELGGMLVTAFLVGAVLALGAALLVYRRFDPLPALPPGPVLRVPATVLAVAGATILVAAWVGSRLVQRRADRANVAEVMRAA